MTSARDETARLACLTDSWNDENTMLPLVFNELQRILDLPNREVSEASESPWSSTYLSEGIVNPVPRYRFSRFLGQ